MIRDVIILVLAFIALFLGAEGLVRGSASLALRLGLTPLVIGLTVVAFGTSMPELVVSIRASLTNQGDIAVGNVVGSNIFNIGVILGLGALARPITVRWSVIRTDMPIMIGVSLLVLVLLQGGGISRLPGLLLVIGLVAYILLTVWQARRQTSAAVEEEFAEGVPPRSASAYRDVLFIAGGLGLLVLAARFLVSSATTIARGLGVSEAVIAITIVAAGTSMPEFATSFVAALRKKPDIALGNIIGSNIFNCLGILGVSAAINPLRAPGITGLDLWVMVAFAATLLPLLWTGRLLQRWEGGVLLSGYAVYLWTLWPSP
ncbi:MAG: calcium/sodium antiporter [PVC group bacterium]